jgi:2-polyprenyl-3-methyl-5-hydroxy-6-metoxy-1,4-benzoquinol methylase
MTPERFDYTDRDSAPYLQYTAFGSSPVHRNRLACIIRMLEKCEHTTPLRVLEVGCGVGNISIPIASLGYHVKAIDIHGPSVAAASARNPFSNLQFQNIAMEAIDLKEFDAIILTEVIEHVAGYREMLKTVVGGMRPGARLILTFPNGWTLAEVLCRPSYILKRSAAGAKLVHVIKRLLGTKDLTTANESTPHVNFFTLGALDNLFNELSLNVVSFYRYFVTWLFWETFFSERKLPASWAQKDFERSQNTAPARCALWAFLLEKKNVL